MLNVALDTSKLRARSVGDWRKLRGLSRAELARRSGLTARFVDYHENDTSSLGGEQRDQLAQALGVRSEQIEVLREWPDDYQGAARVLAFHEAGHAVVSHALGGTVNTMVLHDLPGGGQMGGCGDGAPWDHKVEVLLAGTAAVNLLGYFTTNTVKYARLAAEHLAKTTTREAHQEIMGRLSEMMGQDPLHAAQWATFGHKWAYPGGQMGLKTDPTNAPARLEAGAQRAWEILQERWPVVERLASLLSEYRELDGDRIRAELDS